MGFFFARCPQISRNFWPEEISAGIKAEEVDKKLYGILIDHQPLIPARPLLQHESRFRVTVVLCSVLKQESSLLHLNAPEDPGPRDIAQRRKHLGGSDRHSAIMRIP